MSPPPSPKLRAVCLSLALLYVSAVSALGVLLPAYNFDLIGYVAVAASYEITDAAKLHDEVYSAVKRRAPAAQYAKLTAPGFWKEVEQNPRYLAQQVPLYNVKPLYTWLVYLVHKLGADWVRATVIVSSAAALFFGLLLLFWFDSPPPYYYLLAALLLAAVYLPGAARLSTPDSLSALMRLAGAWLLVRGRVAAACAVFAASVLARPDNIIFDLLLFAYLGLMRRLSWRSLAAFTLATLAIYAIGGRSPYGWPTLMVNTFVNPIANPADQAIQFSVRDYLLILRWEAIAQLYHQAPAFFALCAAFVLLRRADDIYAHLTVVAALSVAAHFVLFPAMNTRFFLFQYAIIGLSLIVRLLPELDGSSPPVAPPRTFRARGGATA